MTHWGQEPWSFGRDLVGFARRTTRTTNARGSVLVLHGYAEHAGRYAHVVDALAEAGFDAFAYDQRGHGQSPGRRALVRVSDLVDDHLAAREALRRTAPGPVYLLGHSLGGLVTAHSVLRDPRAVAGVLLSSPAFITGHDAPPVLRRLAPIIARVAPTFPATVVEKGVLSRRAEVQTAFDADPLCYSGKVSALTGAEMMRAGNELWALLPRWHLPTLVIHGDADRLITVEGSRRFARDVPAGDVELWEVKDGYHELFNDEGADEAIAKILSWLDQRASTRT